MGNALRKAKKKKRKQSILSTFQREKLVHEFHLFYDLNHDGCLNWDDFLEASKRTCKLNCWPDGSEKQQMCLQLFKEIWEALQDCADHDCDGKVTEDEWVHMCERMMKAVTKCAAKITVSDPLDSADEPVLDSKAELFDKKLERIQLPEWLERYLRYRFELYDRTGDGVVDADEFEYVLSYFGVPGKNCRQAYCIFTKNGSKSLDYEYFKKLALQYYFSNEQSSLGNYITGQLEFPL